MSGKSVVLGRYAGMAAAIMLLVGCASDRDKRRPAEAAGAPPAESESKIVEAGKEAGKIVTQPARDVGVAKTGMPDVLARASADPYSLKGLRSCGQIALAVQELNDVLGPDFVAGDEKKENRAGKIAAAGGKTIVNAFIPFRGLVREITGAAPAQRRLNAAIDAGFARRGFLRGVHQSRGCRTAL